MTRVPVWSRSPAGQWLAAGLGLARLAVPREATERALPAVVTTLSELGALPPPGAIADLTLLLAGTSLDTTGARRIEHARLRLAVARYEDRVLGRLAADRRLVAIRDAYTALDAPLRALAVAVVVSSLAASSVALEPMEPALLRRLVRSDADTIVAVGHDVWRQHPDVFERLAAGYEALCDAVAGRAALLTDADVFTVENLKVLGEMGQRVAVAQIVHAAAAMADAWPKRVKMQHADRGASPSSLEDESAYPAGGLASVATHGALENLVTSELVYMDSEAERGGGIDLFDVRYAEGELLYYTRDEAVIVRPRRVVAFVLHPSLEQARLKDRGVAWQRVVVALGWLLASVRCLERWLGETDLRFLVVIEREPGHLAALGHEEQLVRLMLSEQRDRGAAEVVLLSSHAWKSRLAEERRRADVRAVVIGLDCQVEDTLFFSAHARDLATWCADGLTIVRALLSG